MTNESGSGLEMGWDVGQQLWPNNVEALMNLKGQQQCQLQQGIWQNIEWREMEQGACNLMQGAGSWEIWVPAWPKGRMSVKKCSLRCPDGLELHCWGFRVFVWVLTRHFKQMVMNALSLNPRDGPEHWHILCNTHHNGPEEGEGGWVLNSFVALRQAFSVENHFSINCQEVSVEIELKLKGLPSQIRVAQRHCGFFVSIYFKLSNSINWYCTLSL